MIFLAETLNTHYITSQEKKKAKSEKQHWCSSNVFLLIPPSLPVVVKPSAVAGDDDVVSLFSHVVLARVYQSVDFSFSLFLIILQKETESDRSA